MPDDAITTDVVQPTPGQGDEGAPAGAQPSQGQGGTGPWMSDLQGLGLEETQLSAVDAYLREKWQPRVTQLEQKARGNDAALELYTDLERDPVNTYLAIAGELFGDEYADELAESLREKLDPSAQLPNPEEAPASANIDDPRVKAVVEHFERQQALDEYNRQKSAVLGREENKDIKSHLFDPFVAAAEGDMEAAVGAYRQYFEQVKTELGVTAKEVEGDEAPNVLGSTADGVTPPSVQKKYTSFDEAFEDFTDELRAKNGAPPTVGSV